MGISRFPIRPGVDLRNINSASPRGSNRPGRALMGNTSFNGVCVLCLAQSKEKSICPLGCFGARMDGRRSITDPVLLGYKPDFDKLPSEAEYRAAEEKKDDDAPRP